MKYIIALSGAVSLLLLANIEIGTVGVWGYIVLALILVFWGVIYALCKWSGADEERQNQRLNKKSYQSALDDYDREMFIKETLAA